MPPLIELIRAVPEKLDYPPEAGTIDIKSITSDSRQVVAGSLFAALKGYKSDGGEFIAQAIKAGAAAVLSEIPAQEKGAVFIHGQNARLALAKMAAAFYQRQPEHVVAITGTDGKTSTADFFRQFCHHLGKNSASIGTLGVLGGDGQTLYPGTHTTPDPVVLHHTLADMAQNGISYVAMEASSHGLDQYRLDGVKLQAAAFTNIARDHLDYHGNEENYFKAKSRLFSELLPTGATAVLNCDDVKFSELEELCKKRMLRVVSFGRKGGDYRIIRLTPHAKGQTAELKLNGKEYRPDIPLVGAFQVMNILAALGLVISTGADLEKALSAISHFKGVPGRLEWAASTRNGASIFVDYAHTPMALANILNTLLPHVRGHLHVVFGCGGDRDKGKRPEMGKIAAELADQVIVTDDNPRSEDPALIRKAIRAACPGAREIGDRREAITTAIKNLAPGDVLVIAGKGHEKTQTVGDKIYPFDDVEVARELAGYHAVE